MPSMAMTNHECSDCPPFLSQPAGTSNVFRVWARPQVHRRKTVAKSAVVFEVVRHLSRARRLDIVESAPQKA